MLVMVPRVPQAHHRSRWPSFCLSRRGCGVVEGPVVGVEALLESVIDRSCPVMLLFSSNCDLGEVLLVAVGEVAVVVDASFEC